MSINQMSIPYPDFILNQVLDPEQFDLNNATIQAKVNELVTQLNATGISLDNVISAINNVLTKDNTSPYYPVSEFNPATKGYIDGVVAGVILGQFPDGSITDSKLSNMPNQVKANIDFIISELPKINSPQTITIPTTGWVANTGDYTLKNVLTLNGCTSSSVVTASIINPDLLDVAMDAEIATTVTEGQNTLTVYAKSIPSVAIPIRCLIAKEASQPLELT